MSSQLKDLAKGIIFSGRISEFHLDNLSKYPFIFFEDIKEASLEYSVPDMADFDKGREKPEIIYRIIFNPSPRMDNLDKRIKAIEGAVRTLLWPDTEVKLIDQNSGKSVQEAYGGQ